MRPARAPRRARRPARSRIDELRQIERAALQPQLQRLTLEPFHDQEVPSLLPLLGRTLPMSWSAQMFG